MKHLLIAATALTAIGAASTAHAQTFAGGYIAADIGFTWAEGDANETFVFDRNLDGVFNETVTTSTTAPLGNAFVGFCEGLATNNAFGTLCAHDEDGGDLAVRIGYDWDLGGFVIGVVGDISTAGGLNDFVSGYTTIGTSPTARADSYVMTREFKWMAAARVRAGYAIDRYLAYLTVGYATADVEHTFTTSNTVNSFTARGSGKNLSGIQYGVGAEVALTDHVHFTLEYLMSNFDDEDYTVRAAAIAGTTPANNPFVLAPNTTGTDIRRSNTDFDIKQIRGSFAWRF